MIAVWIAVGLITGLACGYVIGCRQMPRMLARMSPDQVDSLGAKVAELKGLRDGTG